MKITKIALSDDLRAFLTNDDVQLVREMKIKKDFFYHLESEETARYHKKIEILISKYIPVSRSSYGFVKGKSYFDFLSPHLDSKHFSRLDIKKFFHSISADDISKKLKPYFVDKLDKDSNVRLIDLILKKLTYEVPANSKNQYFIGKKILPIGFPCSPIISNLVLRPIDIQIEKICKEHNVIYTRYADDMLFSSKYKLSLFNGEIKNSVNRIISHIGLTLNESKTVITSGHISLNGYVIDGTTNTLRVSNEKTMKLKKTIRLIILKKERFSAIACKYYGLNVKNLRYHNANTDKYFETYCKNIILNKLSGYRAYFIYILKFNSEHNVLDQKSIIKYNLIISDLDKILNEYRN